jgi:hypothetical protein
MIVYHSNGLHVGIHDRRTNETESATLKVLAERIGLDRSRGNLSHDLPPARNRITCVTRKAVEDERVAEGERPTRLRI